MLFIVFVSRVLHGSDTLTGILRGVQAIGGLIGGILVATVGHRLAPRRLMTLGATSFGLLSLLVWNSPNFTHSDAFYVVLFIAIGIPGIASNSGVFSLLQQRVSASELGRVFSTFYMINNSFQCLGMLIAGVLGDRLNVTGVLDGQGALYLVAAAISVAGLRTTLTHQRDTGDRVRSAHGDRGSNDES